MHVARLRGVEFRKTRPLEGRCDQLRARRHAVAPRSEACGESIHKRCDKDAGDIDGRDFLQSGPGGHAVNLEHRRPLIRPVEDIDSGKIRPDRCRRADRERLHFIVDQCSYRPTAAFNVGDPVGRVSLHGRDHATLHDEQTKIVESVALDGYKALQIINARQPHRRVAAGRPVCGSTAAHVPVSRIAA